MNEILLTVIITLLVHSLIGTVIYIATGESEKFIVYYGLGIVGYTVSAFCYLVRRINKWWINHDKRSIFEDENGNRFYCEVKYAKDFRWHYGKMVKRYATKDEWKDLTPFTKEQIELAQRNCDRCKHNWTCTFDAYIGSDKVRCKHDVNGVVTEFDKFEKK